MGSMKVFVLLAVIGFASAAKVRLPSCDECKRGVESLHEHLISEESLAEQMEILIEQGCPSSPNPGLCEEDIKMYMPQFLPAVYQFFFHESAACGVSTVEQTVC